MRATNLCSLVASQGVGIVNTVLGALAFSRKHSRLLAERAVGFEGIANCSPHISADRNQLFRSSPVERLAEGRGAMHNEESAREGREGLPDSILNCHGAHPSRRQRKAAS